MFILQMADAMEMMILSILTTALHCEWQLAPFQQALTTTVSVCAGDKSEHGGDEEHEDSVAYNGVVFRDGPRDFFILGV